MIYFFSDLEDDEVAAKVVPHILKACEVCIVMGLPSSYVEVLGELLKIIPSEYFEVNILKLVWLYLTLELNRNFSLQEMSKERMVTVTNLLRVGHYRAFPNDKDSEYAKENCADNLSRYLIQCIE